MKSIETKRKEALGRRKQNLAFLLKADARTVQNGLKSTLEEAEEFIQKKIDRAKKDIANLEAKLAHVS